jgi:hypothetical protein
MHVIRQPHACPARAASMAASPCRCSRCSRRRRPRSPGARRADDRQGGRHRQNRGGGPVRRQRRSGTVLPAGRLANGSPNVAALRPPPRQRTKDPSKKRDPASSARAELAEQILGAGARQEAADLGRSLRVHVGPHHGRAEAIRPGHDRRFRNKNSFAVKPHPIAAILRVPVDVLKD